MEVLLSSKYQLVIPKEIREKLNLKSGQKIILFEKNGIIHIVPSYSLQNLHGTLDEMKTAELREDKDRF